MLSKPRALSRFLAGAALIGVVAAVVAPSFAEPWPTYRHDNRRSGATHEALDASSLGLAWVSRSPVPPQPAWAGPAKWDAYHGKAPLTPMRDYDLVFAPIAVGDTVYYGSSATDSVHAIDAASGKERWRFTADGPVRIAPSWVDGRLYVGSDDGYAYCLDADSGKLLWRFSPTAAGDSDSSIRRDLVLNNGRLISRWPVRTGVLVHDDARRAGADDAQRAGADDAQRAGADATAYFAASMIPWKESYLCAVDAETGVPEGEGRYVRVTPNRESRTFEGALASDGRCLLTPQGRRWLLAYRLDDGRLANNLRVQGAGSFVMVTPGGEVAGGGASRDAVVTVVDPDKPAEVISHPGALSMSILDDVACIQTTETDPGIVGAIAHGLSTRVKTIDRVIAIDRTNRKRLWSTQLPHAFSHAIADDTVYVGGRDTVYALDLADGEIIWQAPVTGDAYAVIVAEGGLLVSTHLGEIHCFRPDGEGSPVVAASHVGPDAPPSDADPGDSVPATLRDEVRRAAGKQPPEPRLTVEPLARFTGDDRVLIRWLTASPSPTIVEWGDADEEATRLIGIDRPTTSGEQRPARDHRVEIDGLIHDRDYRYRVWVLGGSEPAATKWKTVEGFFNYNVPNVAKDAPPEARGPSPAKERVAELLRQGGMTSGVALVYGLTDGSVAAELARQSSLRVVAVEDDPARVADVRGRLHEAGLYGARVAVLPVDSLDALPVTEGIANLIVSERREDATWWKNRLPEVARVLRPAGGKALLDCASGEATMPPELAKSLGETYQCELAIDEGHLTLTRAAIPGAADWTHQYGTPENQAFCGEQLAGADSREDLQLQWIGRPGPRFHHDRQVRKSAPLAAAGRMFVQGMGRVLTIDAYNGEVLWSVEAPEIIRFNIPRDASNYCTDGSALYAAVGGRCLQFDATDGHLARIHQPTQPERHNKPVDWGYVGSLDGLLVGTTTRRGASFRSFWGGGNWFDSTGGWDTAKVCSDNLFVIDKASGETIWSYENGLIINTTIASDRDCIYFVETRHSSLVEGDDRMLRRDELWEDQYLVALDAADGSRRWERPLDPWPGICMYSLTTGAGRLVLVSSGNGEFGICVFTAAEGQPSWEHRFPWATDNHGGHLSRPAVVGRTLFLRPAVFDLMTGQRRERDMAWGSCGTYACSAEAVFYRAGTVNMFAPATGQVTGWNNLRPDCWLSAIPACGMVLSPEGGGGCWCSGWLETSVGLRPVRYPAPLIEAPTHDFVGSLEIALTARGEVAALSGKHEWADPGKHLPTIHYTIDGSEPTPRSPRYTGPIVVRADETVLKARAFWDTANDCMVCSPVAVDVFRRQYPAPKFTRRRTCFGRPVAIAIAKEDSDGQIRYTTDGTDPTPQSPAYAGPIRLTDTTTLRAATFYAGDRTTDVAEMTYCHVEPLLIDGKEYLPGLRYKYFEEWWDKLPDFDALEPKATGYVDGFTLEPKQRDDAFALQLEGWLNVPTDGTYTFFLQSDDGSRLSIDGKQVVLNDGIHDARVVQSGQVELKAGLHPIRLDYFECFGGQELKVTWEGPKIERQPIPHTRLYQIESTNKE